jgi:hypothetical protein
MILQESTQGGVNPVGVPLLPDRGEVSPAIAVQPNVQIAVGGLLKVHVEAGFMRLLGGHG